jgi:hypothetical protein
VYNKPAHKLTVKGFSLLMDRIAGKKLCLAIVGAFLAMAICFPRLPVGTFARTRRLLAQSYFDDWEISDV